MRRLAVVVVLAAIVYALRITVWKPKPLEVAVFVAERGLVEETVTNSKAGTVRTRRRAGLSPEAGGRVAELLVGEGDRVAAGAVLLRLASDDVAAQVALQRRNVDAVRAGEREACLTANQAAIELRRIERLAAEQVVAVDALDRARSTHEVAVAGCAAAASRLQQSRSALAVAEVALTKMTLTAPFAGVVSKVDVEVGEFVTPSPPGLMLPSVIELLDPDAIYVSAPIDEIDLARVATGLSVRVTLDAFAGRAFAGRVSRVSPYVIDREGQNRTFEIEVELEDQEFARGLLPGTTADVEVILNGKDDVLRIPSYAVLEGSKALVLRDGVLVETALGTGLRNWEFVEVTSGLSAGDAVVVSLDRAEVKAGAVAVAADAGP